jgi:hypothetical protein
LDPDDEDGDAFCLIYGLRVSKALGIFPKFDGDRDQHALLVEGIIPRVR